MLSANHTNNDIKKRRGLGKNDLNIALNNPCGVTDDVDASSYNAKLKFV